MGTGMIIRVIEICLYNTDFYGKETCLYTMHTHGVETCVYSMDLHGVKTCLYFMTIVYPYAMVMVAIQVSTP